MSKTKMIKPNKRFWRTKRVLITGHMGFLGSHLAGALAGEAKLIVGIDKQRRNPSGILPSAAKIKSVAGDLKSFGVIDAVFKAHKPNIVFHLAAEPIVGQAHGKPVRCFESNIEGTWNLLEACRRHKCAGAVVVASSDKAYGEHKKLPYSEAAPLAGSHPYDVSKSCADLIAQAYWRSYQLPICLTRCGNIYGPGDVQFSRIVPGAMKALLGKKRFLIRSDGKFIRDYIYIKDIVSGYILLAEKMNHKKVLGEAFNFSDEAPLSVLALYRKIAASIDKKPKPPKILNKAKYEIRRQYLSSKKARLKLGWRPKYSLTEALTETRLWYEKYLP